MSFQLQEWERGMSSMPLGSGRWSELGVLASPGTALPRPLPKVCVVILMRIQRRYPFGEGWRSSPLVLGLSLLCSTGQCRPMGMGAALQICPIGRSLPVPILWEFPLQPLI